MSPDESLLKLTAEIVSAHASNYQLPPSELKVLIRTVYAALGETETKAG